MDITNQRSYQGSWYVNPNTRTLTSDINNTKIKDRKAFGCMQRLLRPVEDMVQVIRTPIRLADRTSVNRAANSVTIAAGTRIAVNDGYVLTVTERGVECHHGENYDPYDTEAYRKAEGLAGALDTLLRNACGTRKTVAFSQEGYEKWTERVSAVLSYMGIDGGRDFSVNGMKYHKNSEGYWESEESSRAKAAWEMQRADNRTYHFADDRTKSQIAYISGYYLEHASEEMQAAWQKSLEETGVNPFPEDYASTLSKLAMEQDFATGGNDVLFGADRESNIAAVRSILDRIEHPIGDVSEKDQAFRAEEKAFYGALLGHLTAPQGRADDISPVDAYASQPGKFAASKAAGKEEMSGEKLPYTTYESANYRIEPDNENACFTIYNKQGERLGVFFYSDIKCRQDAGTGRELLISENGTAWYDALVLDRELKEDLQHIMGVNALESEPLQGYTLKTHAGTGIPYLIRDGEEGRGGRVLLQNEADACKYEELADIYLQKYPHLIESREEAYIWASFEIRGMAMRTESGIISIHPDNISYSDDSNAKDNWSVRLPDDAYQKIFEWLERRRADLEDMQKFSTWSSIFRDIGIDYERILSKEEEAAASGVSAGYETGNRSTVVTEKADDFLQRMTEKVTQYAAGSKEMDYAEKAFASVGSRAPEEVKQAWMDAAKEAGVNGMGIGSNGMITHISQMMAQRLKKSLTGSEEANDILGNSVSSAIRAAREALYDLEHPRSPENNRSIEVQRQRMKERAFYWAFLRNLGDTVTV